MQPVRPRRVELVVVGDELLSGRTVDTNSAVIGRAFLELGLVPSRVVRVGDNTVDIASATRSAVRRAGVVIVVGGLGPTSDDRTLGAVCSALGCETVMHASTLRRIRRAFRRRGVPMPGLAAKQALVPRGAMVSPNPVGMVPGMIVKHGRRVVCLLPGVPAELEALLRGSVVPFLRRRLGARPVHTLVLRTSGIPESVIAERVEPVLKRFAGVFPAFYPSFTGVDIVLKGNDAGEVHRCHRQLRSLLGEAVYAVSGQSLEAALGALLLKAGLTLATAESCTGGRIGDRLTDVPGSSRYYLGGVVVYSNKAKQVLLGVRSSTLRRYGAVSAQVVAQMAAGVRRRFGTDIGIAVSGIAGPGGGSRRKPVGLVFVAATDGSRTSVEEHRFVGIRRTIKERAAAAALDCCRRLAATRQ
ncbi:MAG: CinA family nicotinamide mononucleotide deamidase-related protein [candidate division WOR-3 bacterium]